MTDRPGSTYRLEVAGPVPAHLAERIGGRFGPVTVSAAGGRAVLAGQVADQAAVRALLCLVWDTGVEVRLLVLTDPADDGPGHASTRVVPPDGW